MDWVEQQKRSLEQDGVDLPAQDQAEAAPAQDAAALRRDDRSRQATPEGEEWTHHIGATGWRGTATSSGSTSISGTRSLFRNAPRSRRGM